MFESKKNNRDSRAGFEREVNILSENLINGRMFFSSDCKNSIGGLKRVRYSPNSRIDLNTIDEMTRTIMMSVNFKNQES